MVTFKCAAVCTGASLTLCLVACPHNQHLGETGEVECDESSSAREEAPEEAYQILFADAPPSPPTREQA